MQYDVLSLRTTATGVLLDTRSRLKGVVLVGTAAAGNVIFRDGGPGGPIRLELDVLANGDKDITLPGEGILFSSNIHVTLTALLSVVIFHG